MKKTELNYKCELILRAIEKFYKESCFVYFHGSHLKGNYKKNSDLDLIIVYDKVIQPFREKFLFEDYLFDVFVYDIESLNGVLHSARLNGQFVSVEALLNSITLPTETKISKQLIDVAGRIKNAGFIFKDRAFFQQYMTGIIDDISDSNEKHICIQLSMDIYKSIVDSILIFGGFGICSRKYSAQSLIKFDAVFQKNLNLALQKSIDGNSTELIELASVVLDRMGGPLREGFKINIDAPRMPLPVI